MLLKYTTRKGGRDTMGKIRIEEKRLIFERKDEITWIEPYGKNCLRFRSTRNSKILDENWTVLPAKEDACYIEATEKGAIIYNGDVSAEMEVGNTWHGGLLTIYKKGKVILKNRFEGDQVLRFIHKEGNNYQIKVIFDSNKGEHFYGLGQEQEECFDRKGSTSNLIHYNTKSSLPVYYSSLGYGFFWNNPAPGRCETTRNHTMWVADSAYQADYFIYVGDTPHEVMTKYCELTGFAPRFPKWAAGFWQCKLRYESQEDLLRVAREYKKRNIPIDAIVIDYFHWTEQGEWQFDPTYWPDPKAMVDELNELGIQLIISIWPTTNPKSKHYLEMSEENMLIRTENGQYGTFDFYGQQTFIDTTNPRTREFVWDIVKKNYYDYGIKNFWLDEAEPEVHPQVFEHLHFYLGNGAQTALIYPYYYVKMFFEGLRKQQEEDIILLTRAAYPGSQKYGAAVWNGDIPSTFQALRNSVAAGLSMSMSGIPWWNSDIGGFLSADIESREFRQLIIRWFQFGLFSPIMRLHGSRKKTKNHIERHPGIIEASGGDNEIWCFGDENYEIIKRLIEMREKMKPYIQKYMDIASSTGAPLMRPMFFDFYEDETCYTLEDQYMFGEDILFAPIMEMDCVSREVYLPKGRWIDINTKMVMEGEQRVIVNAQIHQFIAFVKEGSDSLHYFDV
jgi:alpha-D-xyloside xylohydrolase